MSRPWHEHPEGALAFCIALEALRSGEGSSVEIFCDDPDPKSADRLTVVETTADWTGWMTRRFWGATPLEAMLAAGAEQARAR